ncbi:hypothetical protein ACFQX6_34245 [Streptosporangium lutulentum]
MLHESRFEEDRPKAGLEIELNLVDERGEPAMKNAEVLAAIAEPDWATELGQFNVEINVMPESLRGTGPRGWRSWSGTGSTTRRSGPTRSAGTC